MQSIGRSMDWTLEDNMVDGLFFCATLTGRRGGHTPFVQAGAETSNTGVEAVEPNPGSSWQGHSEGVGSGVGDENAEFGGATESVQILTAVVTDVIKRHWAPPALKCQLQDYQHKDKLSVCRILLLQWTPKLDRGLGIAGVMQPYFDYVFLGHVTFLISGPTTFDFPTLIFNPFHNKIVSAQRNTHRIEIVYTIPRGVTRGQRGHNSSGAKSLWVRRITFFYTICFRKSSCSNTGAPNLLLVPGAI